MPIEDLIIKEEKSAELPPFYDPAKSIEQQHPRARAPLEAVERCRIRHEMQHAERCAKDRAMMMFALAVMINALTG